MLKWGIGAATAALAMAFAGGQAHAQMYVAVGGGLTDLDNADTRIENGIGPNSDIVMSFDTDDGNEGRVALGNDIGDWRLEAEFLMSQNGIDRYNSSTPPSITRVADGNITLTQGMINAYRDFDTGSGFTPFIGIGAGAMRAEIEAAGPPPTAPNSATVALIDNDQVNLGWQAMVGVTIPVMSNMSLVGQYRYFDGGTFDTTDVTGHSAAVEIKGLAWDVGLRWNF